MATFASDAFGGTEGTELSAYDASWTRVLDNPGGAEIAGGRLRANALSNTAYYHSATPPSADYPVQATIYAATVVSNGNAGVVGRASSSANTFYYGRANGTSGWQLYKRVAGVTTQLGSSAAQTFSAGVSYSIKLLMTGSTIELYKLGEGTAAISVTDTAISAAGFAGVYFLAGTAPSDTTNFHIDDWSAGEVSAGQTLSPTKGSVSLSGKTLTIEQSITVSPAVGHVAVTGYAPTVAQSITVAPGVGHTVATGYAPTLDQPRTIAPAAGHVTATGYAPTVDQSAAQSLTPSTAHISLTGGQVTVSQPITVAPVAGRVEVTGQQPTVSQDASVSVFPATGHIAVSGNQPTVEQPVTLAPTVGHVLLSGSQPIVVQGVEVSPQTGRITLTGSAPSIDQARTISPIAGRVTISGKVPTITGYVAPDPAQISATIRLMTAVSARSEITPHVSARHRLN